MPARKRRPRADWVYRGGLVDSEGTPVDEALPTYWPAFITVPTDGTLVSWLYDSQNFLQTMTQRPATTPLGLPNAARAEGRRARVLGTSLDLYLRVLNWVANARFRFGVRVGIFEQQPDTGAALLPANYDMWAFNSTPDQPAVWANQQRTNMWERRFYKEQQDGVSAGFMHIRAWVPLKRCYLAANEGLALYVDNSSFGSEFTLLRFCRSLVVDEA